MSSPRKNGTLPLCSTLIDTFKLFSALLALGLKTFGDLVFLSSVSSNLQPHTWGAPVTDYRLG
jgi:hypothetical protein